MTARDFVEIAGFASIPVIVASAVGFFLILTGHPIPLPF